MGFSVLQNRNRPSMGFFFVLCARKPITHKATTTRTLCLVGGSEAFQLPEEDRPDLWLSNPNNNNNNNNNNKANNEANNNRKRDNQTHPPEEPIGIFDRAHRLRSFMQATLSRSILVVGVKEAQPSLAPSATHLVAALNTVPHTSWKRSRRQM
jgi:hypothetical protein